MGLHDRNREQQNGTGDGASVAELPTLAGAEHHGAPQTGPAADHDPYAELKTRIHHAVIAKLGPELFKRETTRTSRSACSTRSPSSSRSTGRR
jgi:hypothetical protein